MSPDELTLRDLRVQVLAERRDGRLVKLSDHFHKRVARLEQGLEQARDAAREDEQRFQRANSDISKLSDLKLELHKHRERKLTRLAREKVNGQQPSLEAVTEQEREFLESVASVIGPGRDGSGRVGAGRSHWRAGPPEPWLRDRDLSSRRPHVPP